jgi:hypothetical protein
MKFKIQTCYKNKRKQSVQCITILLPAYYSMYRETYSSLFTDEIQSDYAIWVMWTDSWLCFNSNGNLLEAH